MQRYMPQIIVPEIGAAGQQQLLAARVLIVGAGGLGTPVAAYLAAAGVGTIGIADADVVKVSNLSRQFLFDETDLDKSKSLLLVEQLQRQSPGCMLQAHNEYISADNALEIFGGYDIVCDCTDNAPARLLCDSICEALDKPLVYAVVRDWQGYVTVLHHKAWLSLEDVFSEDDFFRDSNASCSQAGIVNSTCGVAGSLQATEVIKIILGIESELDGGILVFDLLKPVFRILKLNKPAATFPNQQDLNT